MQLLCPDGKTPLEIHGVAVRWNAGPAAFKPHAFYLDRDVVLNLSHDYGEFAKLGDGALSVWGDAIGVAFRLGVTTENVAALQALRAGAAYCSVAWERAVKSGSQISAAALVDICLTDCPADRGTAAWVNADRFYDLPSNARAVHSAYYAARDFCDLIDTRMLPPLTAPRSAARASARRPAASPRPAAAAWVTDDGLSFRPRGISAADWERFGQMQARGRRAMSSLRK